MRQLVLVTGVLLAGLASAQEKGTTVDIDGMTSATPGTWVKEAPSNKMRFAQFRIPKAKDDKEDAELVIFKGLGGSQEANIMRWKEQFLPPRGKKIEDVSKVTDIKIGGHDAKMLDVSGTYMFNPAPFNPKSKAEPREGYRLLAIHFEGPKEVYHIKLTGPAKTVEAAKAGFEAWIKGYKK